MVHDIEKLIAEHNPFAGNLVVRKEQIWRKKFPDSSLINAHASNAVFDAIEKIHKGQRQTVGITIVAEKGSGKSHIISRIRHQIQTKGDYVFIYINKYDDLNQIKYEFLQSVTSSMRVFGSQKLMQWQEIAAALINEAKKFNNTPQQYISQYPNWLNRYSSKFVEKLRDDILVNKPEITDPYIVQAILWTLSPSHVTLANHWLSGLEISQEDSKSMGIPNLKQEDRETESLNRVRQILDIISNYRIPIFCFDELDNADVAENGLTTAQVIATLAKDLYNNLKRGIFLLAMYPETWNDQIKALPQSEAVIDRLVSEQIDRQPIQLKYLNADDVVTVVQQWLKEFYEEHQLEPPHSLYPFNETELRLLGKQRPTVRVVLNWCANKFIPPEPPMPLMPPIIEKYYQEELENIRQADIYKLLEDEVGISKAISLCFRTLIDKTIEGVIIESIEEVEPSAKNNGFIDFKIIGKVIGKKNKLKLGVDVVQQDGVSLNAALSRLIDYTTFKLTRSCLVRSKPINPGAAVAKEKLAELLNRKKGKLVGIRQEDIQPILAISNVFYGSANYGLTDKQDIQDFQNQVFDFISQKEEIALKNPLILEIISPPPL